MPCFIPNKTPLLIVFPTYFNAVEREKNPLNTSSDFASEFSGDWILDDFAINEELRCEKGNNLDTKLNLRLSYNSM